MPTIDLTLRKGCPDRALEACMKEISCAAEEILEITRTGMIRISVFEAEEDMILQGGEGQTGICPTVIFTVGPGRSVQARKAFGRRITDILVKNLACEPKEVRVYILSSEGNYFAIGGRPKVFQEKKEMK